MEDTVNKERQPNRRSKVEDVEEIEGWNCYGEEKKGNHENSRKKPRRSPRLHNQDQEKPSERHTLTTLVADVEGKSIVQEEMHKGFISKSIMKEKTQEEQEQDGLGSKDQKKISNVGFTIPQWIECETEALRGDKKEVNLKDDKIRKLLIQIQCMDRLASDLIDGCTDDRHEWKIHKIVKHKYSDGKCLTKVQWKHGNGAWIDLDTVALHEPYVCVTYARKNQIFTLPGWEWCKNYSKDIRKFSRKVYAFKTSRAFGPKYMFGVEVPRSPTHALLLDKKNGNNLWKEAMDKELNAIMSFGTFRVPDEGEDLSEYQKIPYHVVFAVKHDGQRKACLVAGGHKTGDPTEDLYSGVVGIGNVRLLFLGLEVRAADISNAYLYSKTQEKCMILAGPEFGKLAGKLIIIYKSLYRLKSAAARFHEHLVVTVRRMGYRPSKGEVYCYIHG